MFGSCAICGKEIREWANMIYNQIVKVKKELPAESHESPPSPDEPLKILKIRYAKGEITKEEYEQKKRDLES